MASTLRNDTRRALVLERLAKAGDKRPDLSLGQLIAGGLDTTGLFDLYEHMDAHAVKEALERMSDTEIIERIERFVDPQVSKP